MSRVVTIRHNRNFNIFQDWKVNKGNFKGRLVLVLFRLATWIRSSLILCILFFWYLILYRLLVEWFLNIEIHWNANIGKNLRLEHGHGTVVHGKAVIGENCTIRHLTSIGIIKLSDGTYSGVPVLGNNVDIGVAVTIIGTLTIGDNVTIGAASLVARSVPSNCTILGNPARIIKRMESLI